MHKLMGMTLVLFACSNSVFASEVKQNQVGVGVATVTGKGTQSGQSVHQFRVHYQRALSAEWRWELGVQRFSRQGGMMVNDVTVGGGRLNFESFDSWYTAAQWGFYADAWMPYVKAGLATSRVQDGQQKKHQMHGLAAIGVGYQFTPAWSLAAEAGYYPVNSHYKLSSYGLSINYSF